MAKITKRHYTAALKLANDARKALGKRPVKKLKKGIPGDPNCCAIAKTIDTPNIAVMPGAYPTEHVVVLDETDSFNTITIIEGGKTAYDFTAAFDGGLLPELVKS